ncbi:MAG: hypothetical protein VYB37_02285 [Pseudomonadota bacterium]|nr:hypothetical protein [Pseudomonadota bacterium]
MIYTWWPAGKWTFLTVLVDAGQIRPAFERRIEATRVQAMWYIAEDGKM